MMKCKHCGSNNVEEIKPVHPEKYYNFIEIRCLDCKLKSLIHADE